MKQWDLATFRPTAGRLLTGNDPTVHADAGNERALALKPGGDLRLLNLRPEVIRRPTRSVNHGFIAPGL